MILKREVSVVGTSLGSNRVKYLLNVGLAGIVVKAPGDRKFSTSLLMLMEVAKINVKNPQLKARKLVFTLIRT